MVLPYYSISSFYRHDMTLAVAEALNPNEPNQTALPLLGHLGSQRQRSGGSASN